MRSTKLIRTAKAGYLTLSAAFCALGAFLMLRPGLSVPLIERIVGVGMVAFGLVKLLGYFSRDLYRLAFQHDLAFGSLLVAMGLLLLLKRGAVMSLLCSILGVAVVADGFFKAQTALDARRFGLSSWWLMLVVALAAGAVGVALVACPAASVRAATRLLGFSMLMEGALNLCVGLCAVKIIRHQCGESRQYL